MVLFPTPSINKKNRMDGGEEGCVEQLGMVRKNRWTLTIAYEKNPDVPSHARSDKSVGQGNI